VTGVQTCALPILTTGYGLTKTTTDYIDVNGDGLPDRVTVKDNGSLEVRYNTGYSLTEPENLSGTSNFDSIRYNYATNIALSGGEASGFGGGSFDLYKGTISGGISGSKAMTTTVREFMDINGDGLPDRLEKSFGIETLLNAPGGLLGLPETSSDIKVRYNTGSGFTDPVTLKGSFNYPMFLSCTLNGSGNGAAGINFTIIILGVPILDLNLNAGGTAGASNTRQETMMTDINGDGYPDHIKNETTNIDVKINRTGKTNLLKTVTRPLGGKMTFKYTRKGNTQNMPQSRWVMQEYEITDGISGPGEHSYKNTFAYADGKYDRGEKEFYGFAKVTETRADGSETERHFDTTGYYTKGLETKSISRGTDGKLLTVSENTFAAAEIIENKSYFPQLRQKTSKAYEGLTANEEGTHKIVTETYEYDQHGNVIKYTNTGDDQTPDDNVTASIQYEYRTGTTYMTALPILIRVTDRNGGMLRERKGIYDAKGNMRELRQSSGGTDSTTNLEYDTNGNLYMVTDPPNSDGQRYTVTYAYDPETQSRPVSTRDSFGYASYAAYNHKYGLPVTTTDTNRNSVTYRYDRAGRLMTVTGPYDTGSGNTIEVEYRQAVLDASNNITSPASTTVTHRDHRYAGEKVETYTYSDGLGRIIQTKKSAAVNGQAAMTVSGAVEFDNMGRVVRQGQPVQGASGAGWIASPMQNPTTTLYDATGRQSQVTYPDGSQITIAYDFEEGYHLTRVTDRMNKEKKTLKNSMGSIMSVKEYNDGQEITTSYKYDPMNQITRVIDHAGNTTKIIYDLLGRRTEIDNPDAGRVQYVYDTAGNMIRKITPNLRKTQQAITYKYDFNRLKRIDYPTDPDVIYTYGQPGDSYNTAGRIKKVEIATGSFVEEFGYGRIGETVMSKRTIKDAAGKVNSYTTRYEYDNMGRMRSLVYPDGELLVYTYDEGGLLASAYGQSKGETYQYIKGILYDEFGQRTLAEYGNGTKTTYQYDPQTRYLTHLNTTNAEGKVFQNLTYEYDAEGNITKRENNDFYTDDAEAKRSTQTYQYDDLHRLVGSTGSYNKETWMPYYKERVNTYTNNISYSPIGNILRKEQVNRADYPDTGMETITATTYDNAYEYASHKPHAVTKAGTKSFTYDDNGNMTKMVDSSNDFTRDLTWDEENRLMKTVDTNGTTTYKYDPSGNRTIKSGKFGDVVYVNPNYTVRNGSVISKHVFAGNSRVASKLEMTDKQGAVDETGIYYSHSDHLGSSSVITAKDGSFHESIEYFPYGETWVHNKASETGYTTPYKFTSKELDPETGLYYFGARYYDPVLSRWISTDPLMVEGGYFPQLDELIAARKNNEDYTPEESLPGMGGVYNPINIDVYQYAGNNPVRYIDPDGKRSMTKEEADFVYKMIGYQNTGLNLNDNVTGRAYSLPFGRMGTSPNPMGSTYGKAILVHEAFHQYQYSQSKTTFPRLVFEQIIHLFNKNKVYNYGKDDFLSGKSGISKLADIKYREAQAQFVEDFTENYLNYERTGEKDYKERAQKYAEVLYNSGIRSEAIDELRN